MTSTILQQAVEALTDEECSDLRAGACVFRCPPYDKNPQSQRIGDLMERLAALQQQPEPVAWRELSEDELLAAIQSCGRELHGGIALTYESGPYDIDRPTLVADKLARAIQQKFMAVNAAVLNQPAALPESMSRDEMLRYYSEYANVVSHEVWAYQKQIRDLKAALQQQEEPREALTVWFGPMPESNGKANWTAILHRGDMVEGFTVARSEHHDRVRYEADRVRHLIGELPEPPDILAYNAEMLSPEGWRHPCASPSPQDFTLPMLDSREEALRRAGATGLDPDPEIAGDPA